MTVINEFLELRTDLLEESKGQDGFIDEQKVLSETLPMMLDAKLVDSEDFNEAYFLKEENDLKINGYAINETEERLQIFIVDQTFVDESLEADEVLLSDKSHYEKQFRRATKFVRLAIDGSLIEKTQGNDPAKPLIVKLAAPQGIEQFDVIEVFLVTLSATVSRRGRELQPRDIYFDKEDLKVSKKLNGTTTKKNILLLRRVIDLNFIHSVNAARGNREPLKIDLQREFNTKIEVIQAADEANFKSYLCVLNAEILASLYKRYSSQLLEKNVRSFLQFKGVNKGIRDTIRDNPEKFIAYNNGLTITVTDAKVVNYKKKTYIEEFTDFQIVNGGQTTASIYFSKKDGLDISNVRVMAKINVVTGKDERELDELIGNISKFSNTQSRVSSADLSSRNTQLRILKNLSNSVPTPSGNKWFFERAKGEFSTSLRLAGGQTAAQKRKFPSERRFSKVELAKYHTAWGDVPFMVKKGGEKVFRHFIEVISPSDNGLPVVNVDRVFYEELIAKIILFRQMEKIYGRGKNAIGQIRSAAIPYAISCLYEVSDGAKKGKQFNLERIWKNEGIEDTLQEYLKNLLQLTNDLIKTYSLSDDFGEYSKRPELWEAIRKSPELKEFMKSPDSLKIQSEYLIETNIKT